MSDFVTFCEKNKLWNLRVVKEGERFSLSLITTQNAEFQTPRSAGSDYYILFDCIDPTFVRKYSVVFYHPSPGKDLVLKAGDIVFGNFTVIFKNSYLDKL